MVHDHGHSPEAHADAPRERVLHRRLWLCFVGPLAVVTVVLAVLVWPSGAAESRLPEGLGIPSDAEIVSARVTGVLLRQCETSAPSLETVCDAVTIEIAEGAEKGETATFETVPGPTSVALSEGDRILVVDTGADEPLLRYTFYDYQRSRSLWLLAAIFVGAVLLLARRRGLGALAGLAFTIVVLAVFLVPAILDGSNPVVVALVAAIAMTFVTLYLAHGFHLRTTTALIGTIVALALTAALGWIWVSVSHITGLATEEQVFLRFEDAALNFRGLLLAGMIVGALGVLDDVTVTQASSVWELRRANPALRFRELMSGGMRIGRDHVASTVNTLVLAYAGASLSVLLLLHLADQSLGTAVTGEVIALEVIRTLVGSLGIVAGVPITTALAAWAVGLARPEVIENAEDGTGSPVRSRPVETWWEEDVDPDSAVEDHEASE